MIKIYPCPYCGQTSYAKTSKNKGLFPNWESTRRHVSMCKLVSIAEYYIDSNHGPIHYSELLLISKKDLLDKYPKISLTKVNKSLKSRNLQSSWKICDLTKEDCIEYIKQYYLEFGIIPQRRSFEGNRQYPSCRFIINLFGSWNNAIEAAGFISNPSTGFGIKTIGLDGKEYKSKLEAEFVNRYLYNKYSYTYEVPYNDSTKRTYDFYIYETNKYVELDGLNDPEFNSRKEVMSKKLEDNKDINFIIFTYHDVYKRQEFVKYHL